MAWFCEHEWEKFSEVTLPSGMDQMGKYGCHPREVYLSFFVQTHIVILTCKKCGKVYKSVTRSQP